MKKNIVKTMLKAIAATAMVATMFIGVKSEAKACTGYYLSNGACICDECYFAETGKTDIFDDAYELWVYKKEGLSAAEAAKKTEESKRIFTGIASGTENPDITTHKNMLKLVNADRAKNGAGKLAWNEDLEAVARQRAYEVYCNAQSEEYVTALNTGDYAAQAAIVHNGSREGMQENAIVSLYTGVAEKTANQNWIASEGHHVVRINAGYTQYACASYTDQLTGVETWVEVFADNNFGDASSFDYIRYATEYPDLAAAFGQDKNALYKHFITHGKSEGRKAYYTDGTAISF